MSANPPTKHHYIPAFYLRRWGVSEGRVIEYSKPYRAIVSKLVSPEHTGYQDRLYELKGFEPELAQQVEEKFFKPLDTWASDALELLERYGHRAPWTSESRSAWTRFMLSLLLRCPEDISEFRGAWHKCFVSTNDGYEARYRAARASDHPATFSEFLTSLPLATKERYLFKIFNSLVDHAGIGEKINEMNWRVLMTPSHAPPLLTSDRPIIRTHNLAQSRGHIALPIGPRLLFIASHDSDFVKDVQRVDHVALAKECNKQVVEAAVRFVYGTDRSQERFIVNRFGKLPQPRIVENIIGTLALGPIRAR